MIFRARFVVPVDGPPIENGAIAVEAGRITAVGRMSDVQKVTASGHEVRDFGDAVILPGFVNAHTHLELSDLAGRVPPSADFTAWLRGLFDILSGSVRDEATIKAAVRAGVHQSLSAGVTTIGDITRYPAWSRSAISQSPLRAVSYGEIAAIGNRRHLLAERMEAAAATTFASPRLTIGISPHAPYTVEPDALRECLCVAQASKLPVCMHLAEVADEDSFTAALEGSLGVYLAALGVVDAGVTAHGCRPVEMLDLYDFPRNSSLFAHVNYVSRADLEILAGHPFSVVYCPRTHAAFGHPPHPFRDMLAAGINVCLGTDSLASNPSLSILDEVRFLHARHPEFAPELLMRMATIHGARALNLTDSVGSLAHGKSADFVAFPLVSQHLWESVLSESAAPIDVFSEGRSVTSGSASFDPLN